MIDAHFLLFWDTLTLAARSFFQYPSDPVYLIHCFLLYSFNSGTLFPSLGFDRVLRGLYIALDIKPNPVNILQHGGVYDVEVGEPEWTSGVGLYAQSCLG